MSKLSDYSKFDNLDSGSDDDDDHLPHEETPQQSMALNPQQPPEAQYIRIPDTNRFTFLYKNKPVYEWEQRLDEVVIFIAKPPLARPIDCRIQVHQLTIGIQGNPPFLQEQTYHSVNISESTWLIEEDDQIVIYLHKANPGMVWHAALKGRFDVRLAAADVEEVRKELLRERWQLEHPGMDFRNAAFTGAVPDPRTFMGGIHSE